MNLVWKLLRSHISISQFIGFFFANLFGMLIVLFALQFYYDVIPVFTQEDDFLKSNYIMVSKSMGAGSTLSGNNTSFSESETSDFLSQSFVEKLSPFTSTAYKLDVNMGINGEKILSSELYFESVEDDFVDIAKSEWQWKEGDKTIPVIIPRTFINMYNFGFAQSRNLPKISEGLMGMIDFHILIHAKESDEEYKGRVVGFSSSLSSIIVPQSFMEWSNHAYAPDTKRFSNRLLLQVKNPADENINTYLDSKGYEIDSDFSQEKTTYFLRVLLSVVIVIGLIISALSFYILMLSIYLLVQKNTQKLENLMLIGYTPGRVALPYQLLTVSLNAIVLFLSIGIIAICRTYYIDVITVLFPDINIPTILPALICGFSLFILVTLINVVVIKRKMIRIWFRKE